jgi:hypothetical protein
MFIRRWGASNCAMQLCGYLFGCRCRFRRALFSKPNPLRGSFPSRGSQEDTGVVDALRWGCGGSLHLITRFAGASPQGEAKRTRGVVDALRWGCGGSFPPHHPLRGSFPSRGSRENAGRRGRRPLRPSSLVHRSPGVDPERGPQPPYGGAHKRGFQRGNIAIPLWSALFHGRHGFSPRMGEKWGRNYLSSRQATPGSSLPSRNSRLAPPPVEIWVILSA